MITIQSNSKQVKQFKSTEAKHGNIPDKDLIEIIRLSLLLDVKAYNTYLAVAQVTENEELKEFWSSMAAEEKEHAGFWRTALKSAKQCLLPQLFDNPPRVKKELKEIENKVNSLLNSKINKADITETFLMAYRMEFYMTHPVFETLFQCVNSSELGGKPENYYELHITKFIDALNKFGAQTPVLELMGESLQHLWRENRNLSRQNSIDELTGVRNRRGFLSFAGSFGSLAGRNGYSVGIMMCDIDHFKKINDTYGHQKGDEVLRRVSRMLADNVRRSDVVARYGGEEFIVFMPQVDPEGAFQAGEKLRKAVEQEVHDGIWVTISVGISCGAMDGEIDESLDAHIHRADACLYEAKNTGRNKVVI